MIVLTTMSGKGFITHEDQTKDELRFSVLASVGDISYVKVTGDSMPVLAWMNRVKGVEVTQTDVDVIIAAQPPSELAQIRADIAALGTTLKADVGLVAVDVKAVIAKNTATVAPKVG